MAWNFRPPKIRHFLVHHLLLVFCFWNCLGQKAQILRSVNQSRGRRLVAYGRVELQTICFKSHCLPKSLAVATNEDHMTLDYTVNSSMAFGCEGILWGSVFWDNLDLWIHNGCDGFSSFGCHHLPKCFTFTEVIWGCQLIHVILTLRGKRSWVVETIIAHRKRTNRSIHALVERIMVMGFRSMVSR